MFVLRSIDKSHRESNISLGEEYHLVLLEESPKEFKKSYLEYHSIQEKNFASFLDDVYGYVVYNDGKDIIELVKTKWYYIMLGDGNTFANLTFK